MNKEVYRCTDFKNKICKNMLEKTIYQSIIYRVGNKNRVYNYVHSKLIMTVFYLCSEYSEFIDERVTNFRQVFKVILTNTPLFHLFINFLKKNCSTWKLVKLKFSIDSYYEYQIIMRCWSCLRGNAGRMQKIFSKFLSNWPKNWFFIVRIQVV